MVPRSICVALLLSLLSGCNVCEDLDARVCADLGEDDCAYWKSKDLDFTKTATQGRQKLIRSLLFGPGASACEAMGHDQAYDPMLKGTKAAIAASRKADEALQGK